MKQSATLQQSVMQQTDEHVQVFDFERSSLGLHHTSACTPLRHCCAELAKVRPGLLLLAKRSSKVYCSCCCCARHLLSLFAAQVELSALAAVPASNIKPRFRQSNVHTHAIKPTAVTSSRLNGSSMYSQEVLHISAMLAMFLLLVSPWLRKPPVAGSLAQPAHCLVAAYTQGRY